MELSNRILCVDLDGTLLKTDMLLESYLFSFKKNPFVFFLCLYWFLSGGKALLKYKLASRFVFDPSLLPYNSSLIDFLKSRRSDGWNIYLVSASNERIVRLISDYLGFFSGCFGSSDIFNLSSTKKASFLSQKFGEKNFVYCGNSHDDIPVWAVSDSAVCVNTPSGVKKKLKKKGITFREISDSGNFIFSVAKAVRVHQWAKNSLLFVPLVTAKLFFDYHAWESLIIAFLSFSFMSSFVYILNDLLDLESDRSHQIKRKRPFASGDLSIAFGMILMPLLFLVSVTLSVFVSDTFVSCLFIYLIVTSLYSFKFKQLIIADCLVLSFLYTFRMLSGIAVLRVPTSLWLITFSGFFFLALAVVKRMAELKNQEIKGVMKTKGRGYVTSDYPMLSQIAVSCGMMSTLVFALYVNSSKAVLFPHPAFIYFCGPVLVFWFCYVFLQTHRGKMDEDPVMFAVKDKISLLSGFVFIALFLRGVIY